MNMRNSSNVGGGGGKGVGRGGKRGEDREGTGEGEIMKKKAMLTL